MKFSRQWWEDLMLDIAIVEGEGWLEDELIRLEWHDADEHLDLIHPESLVGAMRHVDAIRDRIDFDATYPVLPITKIYGGGDWNRYYVYANGVVRFAEDHAISAGALQAARDAGFLMWP